MAETVKDIEPGVDLAGIQRQAERARQQNDATEAFRLVVALVEAYGDLQAKVARMQQLLDEKKKEFSPEEGGQRILENLKNAEGGSWSAGEVRKRFGLSTAVLHRRRKEHRIIYWQDAKGSFFYPKWQFTETGALFPGIQEVLKLLASRDEWRIMRYFLGQRLQLGNRRPLDLIRAGEIESLVQHARIHVAENTW